MKKGKRVKIIGDSVMHGHEGKISEIEDGFIVVEFVNWSGPYKVKIWEGYVKLETD